jgi:DNA-binding GntR family transcriptional regulator
MEFFRVDTQHAYKLIREKITTLELAPGGAINDQALAKDVGLELTPVREALKLLAHDGLVDIQPKGIYVVDVSLPDLEQLSELRLILEAYCAQLAAKRAGPDDIAVLDALCAEQASIPPDEARRLFEVDHKFHQAVAQASHNRYLATVLESFFGLSQRLWYLVLPHLKFLPAAVEMHLDMVDAIKTGDEAAAAEIMRTHIQDFYDRVQDVLSDLADD